MTQFPRVDVAFSATSRFCYFFIMETKKAGLFSGESQKLLSHEYRNHVNGRIVSNSYCLAICFF